MKENFQEKYKKKIAEQLGLKKEQVSLSAKGRIGLYGILQALNIGKGDEVIIPAFTCVVVPNAIIYVGAKPIYVDIHPKTYTIDPDKVKAAITPRTKAILAQNTFGLSADNDALQELCTQHNLTLIEDCTHGYGGTYKGKMNGTIAQAAFFSSQWNKTFSTGFGGITVCKDVELSKQLEEFESSLSPLSFFSRLMLQAQIFTKNNILTPSLYWQAIKLYRFLSKTGLLSGSSSGEELSDSKMPKNYLQAFTEMQAQIGLKELENLSSNLSHRKKISRIYQTGFENMGFTPIFIPKYADHTFILYPFFVRNRPHFTQLAEKARVPLNDWLNSPIHPIQENFENWQYQTGSSPIAERISKHILNLPTHHSISETEAERILKFLENNQEQLISPAEFYRES